MQPAEKLSAKLNSGRRFAKFGILLGSCALRRPSARARNTPASENCIRSGGLSFWVLSMPSIAPVTDCCTASLAPVCFSNTGFSSSIQSFANRPWLRITVSSPAARAFVVTHGAASATAVAAPNLPNARRSMPALDLSFIFNALLLVRVARALMAICGPRPCRAP